jgi:DNA-binding MarR family transcriptional regulator
VTVDYEERYLSEPGAVGLFTRLTRVGLLVEAFQHRCLDPFGLRFSDYSVLRVLELVGEPHRMSPTELSEIVVRSSGGMTQILDRLEGAGLLARAPDPADRRMVLVALTDECMRTSDAANARYASERERLLADLSSEEVQQLDDAIHRLLDVMTADSAAAV